LDPLRIRRGLGVVVVVPVPPLVWRRLSFGSERKTLGTSQGFFSNDRGSVNSSCLTTHQHEVQEQPWQPDWPRRDEIASDQGGTSTRNRVRNFASERYSSPAQCPPTHFGELPVAGRRGPPATHFQQL